MGNDDAESDEQVEEEEEVLIEQEFSSEEEEERDESEEFEDEIAEPITQADEMDVEEVLNEIGEDFDQSDDFDKNDEDDEDEDDEEVDDDDEYDEEGDDDEYDEEGDDNEYDEDKDEENQEELEQWDLEQEQYDFDKNAIETGAVGNIEKSIPLNDDTVADWWEEDNGGGLISIPGLFVFAVAVVGIVYFLKKRASPDTTIRIGYAPVPGAAKSHTR